MHYEVEIGGRRRQVVVTRTGDTFAVAVDGHTRHVDAARIDAHTLSLLVDSVSPESTAVRRSGYEVSRRPGLGRRSACRARRRGPGRRRVERAAPLGPERRWTARRAPARSASWRRCRARSSGCSSRWATPSAPRQPVVVVEAMKMENELRASRDGTVAEIHAREGMSVDAGALLIVIQ